VSERKLTAEEARRKAHRAAKDFTGFMIAVISGDTDAKSEWQDDARYWAKRDALTAAIDSAVAAAREEQKEEDARIAETHFVTHPIGLNHAKSLSAVIRGGGK
jgi:hypothetical protein